MGIELDDLGFDEFFQKEGKQDREYARVIMEHRDRYLIRHINGIYEAEITGHLRFMAATRADLPAVGDWVLVIIHDDQSALILEILPRKSLLERKAVHDYGEKQIIGANIDIAFIVMALDRDFNLNRLERYISIVNAGRIRPVILLSKSDLLDHKTVRDQVLNVKDRVKNPDVFAFSSETGVGIESIRKLFKKGTTYCLMGSSGVGKSTLINVIEGKDTIKTKTISTSTGKGRHSTSYRELRILKEGGILIDTPGMREVGLVDSGQGIELTFEDIKEKARNCKFADCTHTNEPGCAVQQAIREGEIDEKTLENYKKLEREVEWFTSSLADKRKKDKQTGRLYKQIMKELKNKKY
jgi:ribosome biogenesis GTPase